MKYILMSFLLVSCFSKTSISDQLKSEVVHIGFNDSKQFGAQLYCYYVYTGEFKANDYSFRKFREQYIGEYIKLGFINGYRTWLFSIEGKKCKNKLGSKFQIMSPPAHAKYAIYHNLELAKKQDINPQTLLNRDLLRIAYTKYHSQKNTKVRNMWLNLTKKKKEDWIRRHPGRNYDIESKILREYFAYTYQNKFDEGIHLLEN